VQSLELNEDLEHLVKMGLRVKHEDLQVDQVVLVLLDTVLSGHPRVNDQHVNLILTGVEAMLGKLEIKPDSGKSVAMLGKLEIKPDSGESTVISLNKFRVSEKNTEG
jgi:hypothetical protein